MCPPRLRGEGNYFLYECEKIPRYGGGKICSVATTYYHFRAVLSIAVKRERRVMGVKANDIRCDLILLDMKQKELLELLRERGYCCSSGKLSDYINGRVQSEAGMRILSAARDILREKKAEREKL